MTRLSINRRTLAGAAMAILAALLVVIVTRPDAKTPVLVAAADIAAATPIAPDALELREVSDPRGLIEAAQPSAYAGWSLAAPLAAGEPIPASLLRDEVRRLRPNVLALALDEDHAVLGILVPGDLVDVYVTVGDGDGNLSTTLVADAVYVVDVITGSDGFGADRSARLLLAADGALATEVITAMHAGDIDLVRVAR